MGYKLASFNFTPCENEQIEAIIKVPKEPRSVIHGIVKDYHNRVVKDAVVKLFKIENTCNPCNVEPITHTFTDECGQFLFGPLDPNCKYVIKVWINHVKIRELVIKPDECNDNKPHDCKDVEPHDCNYDCDHDYDYDKYHDDRDLD